MKKRIKLLSIASLAIAPLPLMAISCQKDKQKDNETPAYQMDVLKNPLTKNKILTDIANTYLSSFYANEITTNNQNNDTDVILNLMLQDNSNLQNDLLDIFNFYAASKLKENPQYFWNLKADFINAGKDTTDFNPAPFIIPDLNTLKFILKNSEFISKNVRLDLSKLLLGRLYLLKNRAEYRKLANDKNGLDKVLVSQNDEMNKKETPQLKKDIYKALNLGDNSVYLIKYLVDNPIIENWQFSDNRDINLRAGKANVSSFEDFNNLANYNPSGTLQYDYNPKTNYPLQVIPAGDSEGLINIDVNGKTHNISAVANLLAYKGIVGNTNSSGDLASSFYSIKHDLSSIFGFVNPINKHIYDQQSFIFSKIIKSLATQPIAKPTQTLQDKAGADKMTSFNTDDFSFDDWTLNSDKTMFIKTINIENKDYTLQLALNGTITFNSQNLNIPLRLSVKELSARNYADFNASLKYNTDDKVMYPLNEALEFNLDAFPTSVDMFNADKIDVQYVIKVSPLYLSKQIKNIEGKDETKKVLTLEQTPWASEDNQKIIANNLVVLNQDTFFRTACKYFSEIGFMFDTKTMNKQILDILKLEGLL